MTADYGYDQPPAPHDDGPSRTDVLRAALLDSAGLGTIRPPAPLIDGVLYLDSLAWLHGKPGNAKSFLALDWACCVANGLPWQNCGVVQGPVLYVLAEGTAGLQQRVRAWEDNAGEASRVRFLPVAVQLLSPVDVNALITLAGESRPTLIVIDTQARATVGADENSAKDMGQLVVAVDRIRYQTRACVLLVHHEPRNGESMRGSTALEGAATTVVRVTKDRSYLRVENPKQKDVFTFEPMKLRLVPHGDSAVIRSPDAVGQDDEPTKAELQLSQIMSESVGQDGMSPSGLLALAQEAKMSRSVYYRALKSLVTRGEVRDVGSGKRSRYVLASEVLSHVPNSSQSSPASVSSLVPRPTTSYRGGTGGTDDGATGMETTAEVKEGAEDELGYDGDEPPF